MTLWRFAAGASLLLALMPLQAGETTFTIENTNFLLQQHSGLDDTAYTYDYDRLRLSGGWRSGGYFLTGIGDVVNYLGEGYVHSDEFALLDDVRADIPFEVRTEAQHYGPGAAHARIHRLYGGYEDRVQRITAGIQKISMGVGRIWTPTDLYNAKNSYALEPDEVYGVLAATYSYAPSDLSTVTAVVSLRHDRTFKYAARAKGYLSFADVGIDFIRSEDTLMVGYELEGNFFTTGAEWRSEGGYFKSDLLDTEFFQGIAGFDYGFENGITWVVEALYSSETFTYTQLLDNYADELVGNMVQSPFYAGTTFVYDFNLAFSGSFLYIESFDEANSRFVAPSLTYTLNDHNTFTAGMLLGFGSDSSAFGPYGERFYLEWQASY
ncbi:hypothetical protein WCX49_12465 [Sulfurimonas sp. HSL-1656]|uniref:hypothetical protein n=1 Tax=Thiomicrolovo subterrani TaxID=3131934 RepID=UPI0031F9DA69